METIPTVPCRAGGSSGWQAPEQLIARGGGDARQTRSMDVFSLGCLLHFCITGVGGGVGDWGLGVWRPSHALNP